MTENNFNVEEYKAKKRAELDNAYGMLKEETEAIVFDKAELGSLSQTVKNKINATFNNFGMAISYDDKVQIVLSILEDLMEGK